MQSVIQAVRTAADTNATTQDITVSGFGTVAGCIVKISGATADNTNVAHATLSVGIWDATNARCKAFWSESNRTAVTDTWQTKRNDRVATILTTAGAISRYATISAVTDGFRLSWFNSAGTATKPGSAWKIDVMFFGGTALQAAVVDVTGHSTQRVISSMSFQADALFSIGPGAFGTSAAAASSEMVLGFCSRAPSITQGSVQWLDADNVGTSAAQLNVSSTSLVTAVGSSLDNGRVSAFSSTGFTLDNDVQNNAFPNIAVLAIQHPGISSVVQIVTSPTSTQQLAYTTLGHRAQAGMIVSSGSDTVDTNKTDDQASSLGLGFFGSPTGSATQGITHIRSKDGVVISGVNPTVAGSIADAKFLRYLTGSGTSTLVASWLSADDLGVDLDWTTTSATARKLPMILFGVEDIQPTGIATAEAFGTATLAATIALSPGGIASAEAFGTPTVTPGVVPISPTSIPTTEAFGTPTIVAGSVTLSPTAIASDEAFGTPTLSPGSVTLSPTAIASDEAFGTPTLSPGAVTVSPSGIASDEAFGTPTLAATITVDLDTQGIASAEAFGTPTLSPGAVTIDLDTQGVASAEAFGTPTLATASTILPSGIASDETFGTPALSPGAVTIDLDTQGIASAEALGDPVLVQGAFLIAPSAIDSDEAFGTPTVVAGEVDVSPSGISSDEAFGTPIVSPGAVALLVDAILSEEDFGTPTLLANSLTIIVSAIDSEEAFGTPTLSSQLQSIFPDGISSEEAFGIALLLSGQGLLLPTGIASGEEFGYPFLRGGFIKVTLKKKIHDALCLSAQLGTFIEATYDADACEIVQRLQVQPASVEVNELTSGFDVLHRLGNKFVEDFKKWDWELILGFNEEVICDPWVRATLEDPICIPRDQTEDRQVTLKLLDAKYTHPPREGASNGTLARFRFQAELSPR